MASGRTSPRPTAATPLVNGTVLENSSIHRNTTNNIYDNNNNNNNNSNHAIIRQRSHSPTGPAGRRSCSPVCMATPRRRAYSWRGESPPYEKSPPNNNPDKDNLVAATKELMPVIIQEVRAVATWVVGAAVIQICISVLVSLASYSYPLSVGGKTTNDAIGITHHLQQHKGEGGAWWLWSLWELFMVVPSIAAGCMIRVIPPQVISNNYPGFVYAGAWLLVYIKGTMGSLPHIPSRICEAVLGRLSVTECMVVVCTQMVCTVLTVIILQYGSNITSLSALAPIEYTSRALGAGNPWIVDYFHELLVNTIFTVALQVVPVLLQLNRVSPWFTLIFVYPLYTYGVDSNGRASTLSPSILFALSFTRQNYMSHFCRCIPQLLSGVLAGKIMRLYFPDDPSPTRHRG